MDLSNLACAARAQACQRGIWIVCVEVYVAVSDHSFAQVTVDRHVPQPKPQKDFVNALSAADVIEAGGGGLPWWSTDLEGQGIGRELAQSFPTQHLSQLYAGNIDVEIDSLLFPDGALRG